MLLLLLLELKMKNVLKDSPILIILINANNYLFSNPD